MHRSYPILLHYRRTYADIFLPVGTYAGKFCPVDLDLRAGPVCGSEKPATLSTTTNRTTHTPTTAISDAVFGRQDNSSHYVARPCRTRRNLVRMGSGASAHRRRVDHEDSSAAAAAAPATFLRSSQKNGWYRPLQLPGQLQNQGFHGGSHLLSVTMYPFRSRAGSGHKWRVRPGTVEGAQRRCDSVELGGTRRRQRRCRRSQRRSGLSPRDLLLSLSSLSSPFRFDLWVTMPPIHSLIDSTAPSFEPIRSIHSPLHFLRHYYHA